MEFRSISDAIEELKKKEASHVVLITRAVKKVLQEVFSANGLSVSIEEPPEQAELVEKKYTITKLPQKKMHRANAVS